MTKYIFVFSLLFLTGCLVLALKPSPIYGGLGLIISGFVGCLMVLVWWFVFEINSILICLGGIIVVFGYTTVMATEEYPETCGSNWLVFSFLVVGVLMELFVMYLLDYYNEVEVINFDSLGDWLMYEIDVCV